MSLSRKIQQLEKQAKRKRPPLLVVCWHSEEEKAAGLCDCYKPKPGEQVTVINWRKDDIIEATTITYK